jgi:hypothetical protein
MITPPFNPGIHWRRTRWGCWKFVLLHDTRLQAPCPIPDKSFRDADGREWMRWEKGWIIIREGYAWNGNSFAPNTCRNIFGSVIHDAFYQASGVKGFPVSRAEADLLYLAILRSNRFLLATLYYSAVTQFGGIFWGREKGVTMQPL